MSAAQLNPYEEKLMDEITQDNKLMRRKLEGGKERRKSNRKVPVRVYKPDTDSGYDMKKKLEEMEKMQVLYKQRISELENQVTDAPNARSPKGVRSPNRRRRPNDQHYNMSPQITNASPKITHSSPQVTHSPQIGTASPKILHSSPKNYNSSPRPTRSPKAAHYYNTSPRANSSPRRRRNPMNSDSRGNSFVNALDQSKANTSPSRRNKSVENRVLALYDYIPAPDAVGRLAFKEGDVLNLINSKSRSGWWVAEYKGKSGKIPSNYVEQLDMSKSFKARVIKTFEAQQNGDLSIQRGSIITILKTQENGWFLGEKGTTTGFFPATNVEKIDVLSSSS